MTLHYRAEGRQSYAVLLFAPSSAPFDLFDPERKGRVKLYVRRVYITDDAELLPAYLRFMRGVVDSEDLPLNISREMLQNNPQVAQIRKALTGRVIADSKLGRAVAAKEATEATIAAKDMAMAAFGRVLKEGIYEDHERREQLLGAHALHARPAGDKAARSSNMSPTSSRTRPRSIIWSATAPSASKPIPKLEAARARGIEVLLLTDPVDALWTATAARVRGQAAQVAEPGRGRLRPGAVARAGSRRRPRTTKPGAATMRRSSLW